jgi:hypothetical protein
LLIYAMYVVFYNVVLSLFLLQKLLLCCCLCFRRCVIVVVINFAVAAVGFEALLR